MKRIYLAKSNKANPNLVSEVRQTLSKFDVEVVEYVGGTYSHNLLMSCDELIVIPDLSQSYHDDLLGNWCVSLGKGLCEQIQTFIKKYNHDNIFVVTNYDGYSGIGGVYYEEDSEYYSISIENERDYVSYAYFIVNTQEGLLAPWELYEYVLETNNLKDESWAKNALDDSIKKHKVLMVKKNEKFKFILIKKV